MGLEQGGEARTTFGREEFKEGGKVLGAEARGRRGCVKGSGSYAIDGSDDQ
jgi:hypothetical protein